MVNELLKEIVDGYDGLIRKIEFQSFNRVFVTISAMKKLNNEWVNIEFQLDGLKEFTVKQKINCSSAVLSGGIIYMSINGTHYIDFSPYSEVMENEDDFRMSDIYFSSELISYKILPYSE